MSESEKKTFCKPRQVRDQTDGKSDVDYEIQRVKNNEVKISAEMEKVKLPKKINTTDVS